MTTPLIDTHCHLDFPIFESDREAVLERARDVGIEAIVVPGVAPADWPRLQSLCGRSWIGPSLLPAFGIHPFVVPKLGQQDVRSALLTLDSDYAPRGRAVGECGLDGSTARRPGGEMSRQLQILDAQMAVAERVGVPLVLHIHRAHEPMVRFLKERGGCSVPMVFHSFSGSIEHIKRYLDYDAYFGFGGAVTRPNARRPHVAVRAVPIDRLLLETDAPDQTPHAHRGQRNEPAFVLEIAQGIAAILERSLEEISALTSANARRVFGG